MTAWTDKLKAYQKEHNCSYKEAMIKCSSGKTKKRVRKPKKEIELDGDGLALGDAERSASLRKLLQEHGDARVIKITVLRTPVQSRTLLNIISLGQFQKNVDALGYDKIFHIGLNIELDDGYAGCIQSYATIESGATETKGEQDMIVATVRQPETLNNIFSKLEGLYGKQLYRYDAKLNNCQNFAVAFLSTSNALSTKLNTWIMQDAKSLFNNMNSYFYRFITDLKRKYDGGILA